MAPNENEGSNSAAERKAFEAVWAAILSEEPALEADRLRIAPEVDRADEIDLIKGRTPIADEALTFSREIKERASAVEPTWDDRRLVHFSAFVFSLEY